jgi:K+-sensing histidine kinase KdpD
MQAHLSPPQQLDVLFSFAEQVIHETQLEDLLWRVAEEIVARLGFIDCVIYVYEAERQVLVQTAAIGDKTNGRREIVNPLVIPLNRGVTGECARTRKPICLPDAAAHPAYVPDNIPPGSEVCVPILAGDRLFGVIDCEHPVKASFGEEHVKLLTCIAALVASQWVQCELIAKLTDAERRARAVSDAKSRFLQNMSHEMRTPLHGVMGGAQLLEKSPMPSSAARYLEMVTTSASLLNNLVNGVLEISQIESGGLQLRSQRVDLVEFFDQICALFEAQMAQKGLDFLISLDGVKQSPFATDETALTKLTVNLVGNALKYTDEGLVAVVVDSTPERLRVAVTDTGCGLSEAEQALVFERFVRTEGAREKKIEGSGVGLALCTELIEALGGEIAVESTPGQGSTFWFILPSRAD